MCPGASGIGDAAELLAKLIYPVRTTHDRVWAEHERRGRRH